MISSDCKGLKSKKKFDTFGLEHESCQDHQRSRSSKVKIPKIHFPSL